MQRGSIGLFEESQGRPKKRHAAWCGQLEEPASGPQAPLALGTDRSASFYFIYWVGTATKPQLHPHVSGVQAEILLQGPPLPHPGSSPRAGWTSLSPFGARRQVAVESAQITM